MRANIAKKKQNGLKKHRAPHTSQMMGEGGDSNSMCVCVCV